MTDHEVIQPPSARVFGVNRPRTARATASLFVLLPALLALTPSADQNASASTRGVTLWVDPGSADSPGTPALDGEPATAQAAEPTRPVETVVLVDRWLLDSAQLGASLEALAAEARQLVQRGPVEVVVLGERARIAVEAGQDANALAEALSWLALRETGLDDGPHAVRREFLRQASTSSRGRKDDPVELARVGTALRGAVRAENAATQERQSLLVDWLSSRDLPERGVVVWLAAGFDAEPDRWYRDWLRSREMESLGSELDLLRPGIPASEIGRLFAAYHWIVLPLMPPPRASVSALDEASLDPATRRRDPLDNSQNTTGVRLDKIVDRLRRDPAEVEPYARPASGLEAWAEPTSGRLSTTAGALVEEMKDLDRRRLFTVNVPVAVNVPGSVVQGDAADLLSVSWSGRATRSPGWLTTETPRVVSALRAQSMLSAALQDEQLMVTAAFRVSAADARRGELAVQVADLELDASWPRGPVRVSVAIEADTEGGRRESLFVHRRFEIDRAVGEDPGLYLIDVPLPQGADTRLGVVVEELTSRAWGGGFAALFETGSSEPAPAASLDSSAWLLPAPKLVHLLLPEQPLLMGSVVFESVVSSSAVRTVEYWVDGELQASVGPPFRTDLDLGRLPTPKRIEVVARDAAGHELERDLRIVNEGGSDFGVRVVSPSSAELAERSVVGPLTVEVDVRSPRDQPLDRIEFFWNTERVATLFRAPFRQTIEVPTARSGYVRVVGYLADGTSTEDVLLVNSPGSSERVDVDLVELYVVVTDRKGEPVRGLAQENFKVLEDGRQQQIQTFGEAVSLPLTVGLAIDSSASMFVKLDGVRQSATGFLSRLESPRDRAFVVGFGDQPVLHQGATSDPARAAAGLARLSPSGSTGLWRATVFSLVQLQGVRGKKALIVYSDGADEDKDFSFRTCYRFAQRVGVPIYVIVSNDEIERTGGRGLSVKPFLDRLERLTKVAGGRVFLASVDQDLDAIYSTIGDELRSQYLLGYYADRGELGDWRAIDVDVQGLGLKARTISGYYR